MSANKEFAFVSEPAILIIDDNFAIREALTDVLSLFLKMPGMNGQQTYENLLQIAPQVKVIISSSVSLIEARSRFGKRKFPIYLQKPYDLDALLNVVQAELAPAQINSVSNKFVSLPQNGNDSAIGN